MNETDKVKIAMRWILGIWISLLSIFVLVSSFQTYMAMGDKDPGITIPSAPELLKLEPEPLKLELGMESSSISNADALTKIWQQRISAYEKRVTAYEKQVAAYKIQMEVVAKSGILARYEAVVTNTLVVYMGGGFFTTFLVWIFGNLLAGATERFTELKQQTIAAANAERFATLGQRETEAADSVRNQPLTPIKLL
ncbi:MAG: hypothetical protein ABI977_09195 [Acidobacteriota bacterium]